MKTYLRKYVLQYNRQQATDNIGVHVLKVLNVVLGVELHLEECLCQLRLSYFLRIAWAASLRPFRLISGFAGRPIA